MTNLSLSNISYAALGLMCAVLISCGDSASNEKNNKGFEDGANGIVGGRLVTEEEMLSSIAGSVVMVNEVRGQAGSSIAIAVDLGSCTGTLVEPNVVITAGHCFENPLAPKESFVVLGHRPNFFSSQKIKVKSVHIHPEYIDNPQLTNRDLAILILEEAVSGGSQVVPLIPRLKSPYLEFTSFFVYGFGNTQGVRSKPLDGGELRKVSLNLPRIKLRDSIIIFDGGGKGVCYGDSGGPAFISLAQQHYLFAISVATSPNLSQMQLREYKSLGLERFNEKYPHLDWCNGSSQWLNLQEFLPWIESTVNKNR